MNANRPDKLQLESGPATDFDPSAFRLPDLVGPTDTPVIETSPRSQILEAQLKREAQRKLENTEDREFVHSQLQQNLKQAQSNTRSTQLKTQINTLKQVLRKQSETSDPEDKNILLESIATLKACYSGESAPKDMGVMDVITPLLKCQYVKWKALKEGQPATPPPPEAQLLKQLRQQTGQLSPTERAALMQCVLLINKLLPHFQSTALSSAPASDLDISDFHLPDLLGPTETPVIEASPQSQRLKAQLKREAQDTEGPIQGRDNAEPVRKQLRQELKQAQSDTRSAQLKAQAQSLKQLLTGLDGPAAPAQKQLLLKSIATLKACYSGDSAPRDMVAMNVITPLLKCQYVKWKALKEGQAVVPPPPEAQLLKKLKQQAGKLSPTERAALMQCVLLINKLLPHFQPETAPAQPDATPAQPAQPASSTATKPSPLPAEFDPRQASRLSLQLRSKLQRTRDPQEKKRLQAELQALASQQQAHREQQQIKALKRNLSSLQLRQKKLTQQQERPHGDMLSELQDQRRKSTQDLQNLCRLCQDQSPLFEAALRQLARLGLSDAAEIFRREEAACQPLLQGIPETLRPVFQHWWQAFLSLRDRLQSAQLRHASQLQVHQAQETLASLQQQQKHWKAQQQKIKNVERSYLESEDPLKRHALQSELWELYAQSLNKLPQVKD